jgi:hypothetical protein
MADTERRPSPLWCHGRANKAPRARRLTVVRTILTNCTHPSSSGRSVAWVAMLLSVLIVFWLSTAALMAATFVYNENLGP